VSLPATALEITEPVQLSAFRSKLFCPSNTIKQKKVRRKIRKKTTEKLFKEKWGSNTFSEK